MGKTDHWPFGAEPVSFHIKAGFSTRAADLDNILKPLLDTFQVLYEDFNDNKVYYIETEKNIVKKGEEYLWLRVGRFNPRLFQDNQQEALKQKQQDAAAEAIKPEVTRGTRLRVVSDDVLNSLLESKEDENKL